ncbi:MAG: putative manganese transporter [Bacillota bacterium]
MPSSVLHALLEISVSAFRDIGVPVALVLLAFGWVEQITAGHIAAFLSRKRSLQPLLGALLGVMPGCGGAILVVPLFARGMVSYGGLVATLVATMGDASWVIIARAPWVAFKIHALCFVTAVAYGYLIDLSGLRFRGTLAGQPRRSNGMKPNGKTPLLLLWWCLLILTALLGLTGVRAVALAGTVLSLVITVAWKKFLRDDTLWDHEAVPKDLSSLLHFVARDTAFVVAWAFTAYALFDLSFMLAGLDLEALVAHAGWFSVVAAAAVGLIPGCGPQIVITGLFTRGVIPFSVLAANAISQDGDALFPLIACDRLQSLKTTIITTVPAILIGTLLYLGGV